VSARAGARDRSSGSSTVWLLGCIVVIGLGVWCTATLAEVGGLRHRVTDAADEAALAAAAALPGPAAVACARAAAVAHQAHAELDECAVERAGATVRVGLSRPLPGLLGPAGRSRAVARAGPAP